mmetsp:Transcript_28996/g.72624  ORF Transcript_28996/g.72624 Transcript_28996/m.72624 type:complete len:560 (+) Transcript_28996:562-2241(+)
MDGHYPGGQALAQHRQQAALEGGSPWSQAVPSAANGDRNVRGELGRWPEAPQLPFNQDEHWRHGFAGPAGSDGDLQQLPAPQRLMFARPMAGGEGQRSSSSSFTEGGVPPPAGCWAPGRKPYGVQHDPARPMPYSGLPRAPSSLRPAAQTRPSKLNLSLNICDDLLDEVNNVLTGTPSRSLATGGGGEVKAEKCSASSAASGDSKSMLKKSAKLSVQPGKDGKVKASNFNGESLSIGSWRFRSRNAGDLAAKVYFAKRKLVWEVLEGERKKKIEFQWSDISAMRVHTPANGFDVWELDVSSPPTFHREMPPQPKKHTLWEACSDFTNGQASLALTHRAVFPNGTLQWHVDRLMEFDTRLLKMMEDSDQPEAEPEPADAVTTQHENCVSADIKSLQDLTYREPPMVERMQHNMRLSQSSQHLFHLPGYCSQFPRVPLDQMPSSGAGGSLDGLPPHMQGRLSQAGPSSPHFAEWVRGQRQHMNSSDSVPQCHDMHRQQQQQQQSPHMMPTAKRQRMMVEQEVRHRQMLDQQQQQQQQQQWGAQDFPPQQGGYPQAMYSYSS